MNELLTKIAVESQVEHCISHVRLQKFAELIVRECADYAEYLDLPGYKANMLKKHFGVEE